MSTALVVDDEPDVRDVVARYLNRDGYRTLEAADGEEARRILERESASLVVLDVMLPGIDGLALCRWIRSRSETPVILLTALGEETDRIAGLELGADDYITKPFSPREVLARVDAVLRRARPEKDRAALAAGPLTLDQGRREALLDGVELALTPREFDLLYFFARHPGRAFSRDELLSKVWGYDYRGETRTVDVHVRRLRAKLGERAQSMIATVTGTGYKLVVR